MRGLDLGGDGEVAEWVGEGDFYLVGVGSDGIGGVVGEVLVEDLGESVDVTPAGKGWVGNSGCVVGDG